MVISYGDLQFSLSAITFLNDIDVDEKHHYVELRRFKCYETAFVISYARAFTKSCGSKYDRISLRKIEANLTDKQKILHKSIIDARHRSFAHSDLKYAHTRIDLYSDPDVESDFQCHRIQYDEGLAFADNLQPYAIMDLIDQIMGALYDAIRLLAIELSDHLPIYILPASYREG